jgi:hypothetical protein
VRLSAESRYAWLEMKIGHEIPTSASISLRSPDFSGQFIFRAKPFDHNAVNHQALIYMGLFSIITNTLGCSRRSSPPTPLSNQTEVTAQLNHKLLPLDRGQRYEDPLNDELKKRGFGETDGGGTMLEKSKEIEFINVEMFLTQTDKSIPFVIERLESYGAPKGSKLIIREGDKEREIPIGKVEGFGVYLDGVNLTDEVYKTCDVNLVMKEFDARLKGHGSIQSHWQGQTETALYIYGDDAELMKKLIAEYMATYPLCKNARVVTLAPKP